MKKATAFVSLITLIAIASCIGYLYRLSQPTVDIQPLVAQIPVAFQIPMLIGAGVFFLTAVVLALVVLFEPSRPELNTVAVDNTDKEEIQRHKSELVEIAGARDLLKQQLEKLASDNADLKKQIDHCISDNAGLKKQLENASANLVDKAELDKERARYAEVEVSLASARQAEEKLSAELKTMVEEKKRLQGEIEALISKNEKSENDCKNARKESEKNSVQLKNALSECEKKAEELDNQRQTIESLTHELKAAQANAKGGKNAIPPAAYQILYLFQKEGRLIDLLSEDISELDDETLGGAIRPIHEGCRKLLDDRLILERVLNEEEGSEVTLDEIDPEAIKLSGRVPASGPYKGELIHRGWRLKECNLPELVDGWRGNVIAPAEIEIS